MSQAIQGIQSEPIVQERPRSRLRSNMAFMLQVFVFASIFILGIFGYAWWRTKSLSLVWQYVQGQRLLVEPSRIALGEIASTTEVKSSIRVVNLGTESKWLIGAKKSCGCMTLDNFPMEIPAGGECRINISIMIPKEEVAFEHSVILYSDEPMRGEIPVIVAGFSKIVQKH